MCMYVESIAVREVGLEESVSMDWVSFGNVQDDDMICRWVGRPVGAANQCCTLLRRI